jgi:hypothetical protein
MATPLGNPFVIAAFFIVIASPFSTIIAVSQSPEHSEGEARQSQKNEILNPKSEILNNIK